MSTDQTPFLPVDADRMHRFDPAMQRSAFAWLGSQLRAGPDVQS